MKVFVTGADGMLGSNIVRTLLREGHQVACLRLKGSNSTGLNGLRIETIYGDLLDPSGWKKYLSRCDAVIHAAASTQVWPGRNKSVIKINVEGTHTMMRIAQGAGIERFVHIGTANSFAPGSLEQPGDENNRFDACKFGLDYIDSKRAAQEMLLEAHHKEGFPVIVINPTFMIGPYDSGPTSGRLILAYLQRKVPGYCRGGKSWAHARDVAQAAVNALHMGRLGECYIAGGQNLSYMDFFSLVSEECQTAFKLRPIPHPVALCAGFAGSCFGHITGRTPKISLGMARISGIDQFYSSEKAIRELNMPQTDIRQAIWECVDWFKRNNYLS